LAEKKNIKLVISDLDGVIRFQDQKVIHEAYLQALRAVGVPEEKLKPLSSKVTQRLRVLKEFINERELFLKLLLHLSNATKDEFKRVVESAEKGEGMQIKAFLEEKERNTKTRISDEVSKELVKVYNNYRYGTGSFERIKPFKNSIKGLQALLKKGFLIVITSNAPKNTIKTWFEKHAPELSNAFESGEIKILGKEDVSEQKPSPEGILKALKMHEENKITIKNALYVGDHPNDVIAAKRAGVTAVGVLSPLASLKYILNEEPHYVFYSFEEMARWLLGKNLEFRKLGSTLVSHNALR